MTFNHTFASPDCTPCELEWREATLSDYPEILQLLTFDKSNREGPSSEHIEVLHVTIPLLGVVSIRYLHVEVLNYRRSHNPHLHLRQGLPDTNSGPIREREEGVKVVDDLQVWIERSQRIIHRAPISRG